jgi:uncharacterized protein YqfB (UPF0267 family)
MYFPNNPNALHYIRPDNVVNYMCNESLFTSSTITFETDNNFRIEFIQHANKNNMKTGNVRNLIQNIDQQYTTGSLVAHNPGG